MLGLNVAHKEPLLPGFVDNRIALSWGVQFRLYEKATVTVRSTGRSHRSVRSRQRLDGERKKFAIGFNQQSPEDHVPHFDRWLDVTARTLRSAHCTYGQTVYRRLNELKPTRLGTESELHKQTVPTGNAEAFWPLRTADSRSPITTCPASPGELRYHVHAMAFFFRLFVQCEYVC